MLRFGRALSVGLAAALSALILADARLGAEPESRGEGRIAFTFGESGADRPAQLAVMDGDGKNRRALPPFDVHGGLSWSPDGRLIALGLIASRGGVVIYTINIYTINADGRPRYRLLVRNGGSPDWSPNGRSIAFDRGRDIWVVDLNDRRQRRIVHDGRSPKWSPDGRKLAFTRGPIYGAENATRGPDLWVLDVVAKKERRLVRNGYGADWSPDGRQIAFDRCRTQRCGGFIYVAQSDGTKQRRLFKGDEPVWSPNGQELVFIGKADGGYDAIIRARLDGSGRRVLFGRHPACGCVLGDWARASRGRR